MRIKLIYAPDEFILPYLEIINFKPPLGIACLATNLKNHGYLVSLENLFLKSQLDREIATDLIEIDDFTFEDFQQRKLKDDKK